MRAWRQYKFGEPTDVLRLDEITPGAVPDRSISIRPEYVGVNMPDLLVCRGAYQELPPFPFVLGTELAGTVIEVGAGAERFSVGDRVMGMARTPAGALAEEVPVRSDDAVLVPDAVASRTAASIPVNYVTAFLALHTRAHLQAGETVLVQGGAGGVGSAAVQLAAAHGARVIATVIDEAGAAACAELGAELILDPKRDDVVAAVMGHTGGRGVDVAVDPVGAQAFDQCRRCMAFEGRLVVVGFVGGEIATLRTNHPLLRNYAVLGVNNSMYLRHRPDVHIAARKALLGLAAQGNVAPLIHRVWPFTQADAALAALGAGSIVGKALVSLEGAA